MVNKNKLGILLFGAIFITNISFGKNKWDIILEHISYENVELDKRFSSTELVGAIRSSVVRQGEEVMLDLYGAGNEVGVIGVSDMQGKFVYRTNTSEVYDKTQMLLQTEDIETGIYFVTVTSSTGKVLLNQKLIISEG